MLVTKQHTILFEGQSRCPHNCYSTKFSQKVRTFVLPMIAKKNCVRVHIFQLNVDAYALNKDNTAVGKQYIRSIIFNDKQEKIINREGSRRDTGIMKVGSK